MKFNNIIVAALLSLMIFGCGNKIEEKKYFDNGQLEFKVDLKQGKRDGISHRYYENGQLRAKQRWKDGSPDGLSEHYFPNGQMSLTGNWREGKAQGMWKEYYESGKLKSERFYLDSHLSANKNSIMKMAS